jgi:hypothetical protein
MKNIHRFFIVLGFLCLSISLYAQSPPQSGKACYYPSFGLIYQTLYQTGTNDFIYNNGNGPYSYLACSNKTALGVLGTCRVRIPTGQPQGGSYYNGQLFTINQVIPCPLDGYLLYILLAGSLIGFVMIRRAV